MTHINDIIRTIGPERIKAVCDVGGSSIRAARAAGQFPASWFDNMERECEAKGIPCPRELFAFKKAACINQSNIDGGAV